MHYRLVAIDIDGTLVNSAGKVSARTRSTVQRIVSLGVTVVIATGRRYLTARSVARQLDTDVLIAAHNGALLKCLDGRVLYHLELPQAIARQAVDALMTLGYDPFVFQGTQDAAHIWIDRSLETRSEGWIRQYLERNAPYIRVTARLATELQGDVLEVVSVIPREQLAATLKTLKARLGDTVRLITQIPQNDNRVFLEIAHPHVGKSAPLVFLAERLGITPAHVVAFGDNYNDLDMLDYAGLPILMANAHEDLKRHGYRLAPTNDEDGVAKVLDELFPEASAATKGASTPPS